MQMARIIGVALLMGMAASCEGEEPRRVAYAASPATQPAEPSSPAVAFKDVGVEASAKLLQEGKAVALDVRSREEFDEGHIKGATLIDIDAEKFEAEAAAKFKKDQPLLVYCASGGRSLRACQILAQAGFKQLYNLEDGFYSWKRAGKEVVK